MNNLKKINELQGKIEKIRDELKNDNNEKIIKEAQEKIKDLNEQIRNIILKKEEAYKLLPFNLFTFIWISREIHK